MIALALVVLATFALIEHTRQRARPPLTIDLTNPDARRALGSNRRKRHH